MTGALPPPDIEIDGETLRSRRFDDIYFQPDDGLAESRHVFLGGNDLARRFAALPPRGHFTIAELGFGTGLNILAAAELFAEVAPTNTHLHIWSCEAYPLPTEMFCDTVRRHSARWPTLAPYAEKLALAYPRPRPGFAQRLIGERITMTWAFGDVLPALHDANFEADAVFLDGFAPAKNPEMWSNAVLSSIAARLKPGGTVATFTVAGSVRRGLTAGGLQVEKTRGFGRKREMLRARKPDGAPGRALRAERIAIIGGGIAGAATSWLATRAGLSATLFEAGGLGAGASGNPAALLTPRLDATPGPVAHLYRDGFLFARALYQLADAKAIRTLPARLEPRADRPSRFTKIIESGVWHAEDLSLSNGRLVIHRAGLLDSARLLSALTSGARIISAQVEALEADDREVVVHHDGCGQPFDAVIVATGAAAPALLPTLLPRTTPSRGQIDLYDSPPPAEILSDGRYVAAAGAMTMAGATYDPLSHGGTVTPSAESSARNLEAFRQLYPTGRAHPAGARAAVRLTTRDRHPIVGPIGSERIIALCGLGSRGFSMAPLLAAHLVAGLVGGVSPLGRSGDSLVRPDRWDSRPDA
jgi:tRNA 5-methylaminomethyl-2-thiouridine biosynthesis bifunctional protein